MCSSSLIGKSIQKRRVATTLIILALSAAFNITRAQTPSLQAGNTYPIEEGFKNWNLFSVKDGNAYSWRITTNSPGVQNYVELHKYNIHTQEIESSISFDLAVRELQDYDAHSTFLDKIDIVRDTIVIYFIQKSQRKLSLFKLSFNPENLDFIERINAFEFDLDEMDLDVDDLYYHFYYGPASAWVWIGEIGDERPYPNGQFNTELISASLHHFNFANSAQTELLSNMTSVNVSSHAVWNDEVAYFTHEEYKVGAGENIVLSSINAITKQVEHRTLHLEDYRLLDPRIVLDKLRNQVFVSTYRHEDGRSLREFSDRQDQIIDGYVNFHFDLNLTLLQIATCDIGVDFDELQLEELGSSNEMMFNQYLKSMSSLGSSNILTWESATTGAMLSVPVSRIVQVYDQSNELVDQYIFPNTTLISDLPDGLRMWEIRSHHQYASDILPGSQSFIFDGRFYFFYTDNRNNPLVGTNDPAQVISNTSTRDLKPPSGPFSDRIKFEDICMIYASITETGEISIDALENRSDLSCIISNSEIGTDSSGNQFAVVYMRNATSWTYGVISIE
ncbi:MAG: hypothetical protein HWD92_00585 [Flavobacteriia bacterium]|nr:hypothetical protein [Flavobacteriia bacterium]